MTLDSNLLTMQRAPLVARVGSIDLRTIIAWDPNFQEQLMRWCAIYLQRVEELQREVDSHFIRHCCVCGPVESDVT